MAKTKVKKVKQKTHKASAKRFKATNPRGNRTPKVQHVPQGGGNGHSMNYKNRRQAAATSSKAKNALSSTKEMKKVLRLING